MNCKGIQRILLSFGNVQLTLQDMKTIPEAFKGKKKGKVFLTQQRVIFIPSDQSKPMKSFSMPFNYMERCTVEQGFLVSNYIKGKIHAQPGGGWEGTATFKLSFNSGGAIDFGKAMIEVASHALKGPSPYTPVVYVYETISVIPTRGSRFFSSTTPVVEQSQQQYTYVPGPPPPAGGYYAPVPPMYAPYGPPPPAYFGMHPPPNYAPAGTSGYTQPPMMTTAGMPGSFNPSAPQTYAFSSPLTSPDHPVPRTAGTPSDFNPPITSLPNYYSSPLSSDSQLPGQSTETADNTGKGAAKS
ncbi:WW domain-binding protein 2-like [Chiloscyllium plagiosum]|uniref:WW domain-binding protein 2-like n=1 Tax=Chiloscyllium plagiosum TaxID=36176 RepID=UPI001CB7D958|nr:WW domain-binding protein 2-like [Chiloscyllium plagiosum]